MKAFAVEVTREGRWWMIRVPEIDGLTQARRLDEVETMAASLIATMCDVPPSAARIGRVDIRVDDLDLVHLRSDIRELRERVGELQQELARTTRGAARALARRSVPVRDVGTVLQVSPQRVSQLLND